MPKDKTKKPSHAPSLNKFMHPKNPYKILPSFKELAVAYPEFRAHCTFDFKGKAFLDFKNTDALKALTTCLLDKDFGLKVTIPNNRLVPTLPLRMNYLLWINDLLYCGNKKEPDQSNSVVGIDIGTGSICVYPMLGYKKFEWHFVATETDEVSFESAKNNVEKNELGKYICLKQSSELFDVLKYQDVIEFLKLKNYCGSDQNRVGSVGNSGNKNYVIDFTMCNPPFYSSEEEMDTNHNSKNENRSQPNSVSTGTLHEKVTEGGEIAFITRLIEKSFIYKNDIRIFSTLIGKKSDVKTVINLIKEKSKNLCVRVTDTEFCQGRTMRWGVAWSFANISFERIMSKKKKLSQKPYVLQIPRSLVSTYTVPFVWSKFQSWLKDIKIKPQIIKLTQYYMFAILKAYKPTWLHQRQKRRKKMKHNEDFVHHTSSDEHSPQKRKLEESDEKDNKKLKLTDDESDEEMLTEQVKSTEIPMEDTFLTDQSDNADSYGVVKDDIAFSTNIQDNGAISRVLESSSSIPASESEVKSGLECFVKCSLQVKQTESLITFDMNYISGIGKKDSMYQLFQYLNNRLNEGV